MSSSEADDSARAMEVDAALPDAAAPPPEPPYDLLPDPGDALSDSGDDTPEADIAEGLSVADCVARATEAKAAGNDHFKAGENADACQKYQLGVQYLRRHSADEEVRELLLSTQTNLAAAHIRLELWEDAVAAATAALAMDVSAVKARPKHLYV